MCVRKLFMFYSALPTMNVREALVKVLWLVSLFFLSNNVFKVDITI
jgi:hypothetical protein